MNPELVDHAEQLSLSCTQVRPGDIATLADVLDRCETLRQMGEMHQADGLDAVTEAIGEHIKRMIMGESEDDAADLQVLRDAVSALHETLRQGQPLRVDAFPAGLAVTLPESDAAGNGASGNGASDSTSAADSGTPQAPLGETPAVTGGDEGAFAADAELLSEYLTEQRARLEEIEGNLLTLENTHDEAALGDLRRALHTIKGDSGFLGLSTVAQISHAAESYLEAASYPYDLEHLFGVKDWLARAFEDLASGGRLTATTQASFRHLLAALAAREAYAQKAAPQQDSAPAPQLPPVEEDVDLSAVPADGDTAGSDLIQELTAGAENGSADLVEEEVPVQTDPEPIPAEPAPAAAPAAAAAAKKEPFFQLTADESLLVDFISESKEHLDLASAQLLGLEGQPDNEEAINSVFRAFHTVKGIAGFLNLGEISVLAHDTENLLDQVRREELELTPTVIDLVFEALDWMTRLIGNVRTGLEGDGRVATEPELEPFIGRVKAAQQGRLAAVVPGPRTQRVGEILVESGAVTREVLEQVVEEVKTVSPGKKIGEVLVEKALVTPTQLHAALREQAVPGPTTPTGPRKGVELKETLRVDYERLENMINTIGELVLAEAMVSQDEHVMGIHSEGLDKKLYNLRQVSRKLQELGTTIRMVPISGTFQKMARLVRDLSRKSGKPISFTSHGDETELDRAYVDLIADPLVHMIRNAVDHGIESPVRRREAGKPEAGTVELRAFHEGGNIHVEIRDDGAGLDPERIFAKALDKGLVEAEEHDKMTEQEIFQLIFTPGFSTAAQVTEVSGRGVGMDVVRRNINELRGQVQILSELGSGTTFKIILPLTLALIDGMLVRVGPERFIFPVLSVVESARPTKDMVTTVVGKGEMIGLRGRQLPLYRLNRLFEVPDAVEDVSEGLVVVVENEGRQVGIVVDDLVGIQQTVIKNLGNGLFNTRGLSGGSIMADGTVGLIVDIPGLITIARSGVGTLSNIVN